MLSIEGHAACELTADAKIDVSDLLRLAGNFGQTLLRP
jgi:hypothetical protein